jgi:DNA end-binding protein Ku
LHRLHFSEEIRSSGELDIPEDSEMKGKELQMAITLIEQITGEFDISKFKNTYAEQLMQVIEEKAKGIQKSTPQLKIVNSKSQDLMEQLKASLEMKRKKAS